MKVLIIDDSKAVHALVTEMLAGLNPEIFHAYDGAEGLASAGISHRPVDLIFLDWEMPNMTGIEALPLIRAKVAGTPIVMMTSKNAMADISEALGKGATDYIIKPFTQDIILGKVSDLVSKAA